MTDNDKVILFFAIFSLIIGLCNKPRGSPVNAVWWGLYGLYLVLYGAGLGILVSKTWNEDKAAMMAAIYAISYKVLLLGIAMAIPYVCKTCGIEIRTRFDKTAKRPPPRKS